MVGRDEQACACKREKGGNDWDPRVVANFRDSYSPGHDGFCCVQLSISEDSAGGFLFCSKTAVAGLAFG